MSKFVLTVEDTPTGVIVVCDNEPLMHESAAGRVAHSMMINARLLDRIPLPVTAAHPGCDCEVCRAYNELMETNPTRH